MCPSDSVAVIVGRSKRRVDTVQSLLIPFRSLRRLPMSDSGVEVCAARRIFSSIASIKTTGGDMSLEPAAASLPNPFESATAPQPRSFLERMLGQARPDLADKALEHM